MREIITFRPKRPKRQLYAAFGNVSKKLNELVERELSLAPPPLKNRPCWKMDTMVLPFAHVAASTSVACCAMELVNGSLLIWVRGTWACVVIDRASTSIRQR